VLTNGKPSSAEAALEYAGLRDQLDAVISVERARAYKPDPRVYALGEQHYGVPAARIAFVSSNGWDAAGAAAYGYRVIWCNRSGAPRERIGGTPAAAIASLRELTQHSLLG